MRNKIGISLMIISRACVLSCARTSVLVIKCSPNPTNCIDYYYIIKKQQFSSNDVRWVHFFASWSIQSDNAHNNFEGGRSNPE